MNYEERYRGKCLLSVFRGKVEGKIMFVTPFETSAFFRVVVGEKFAETKTYEEAFEILAVL